MQAVGELGFVPNTIARSRRRATSAALQDTEFKSRGRSEMTPFSRTALRGVGVLAVAVIAVIGGFLVGASRTGITIHNGADITIHTGMAHSAQDQISITGEDGWVYNVPLDVKWTDANGAWHENGRPDCLPPSDTLLGPVEFGATQVTVSGRTWRPVVWVSCRG